MKPIVMLSAFFLATGPLLFAQNIWEGNAAQIRRGEFVEEGMFAASNSFPQNTMIEVENPRTGKTVQVTVVKRIQDNPNLFLLLSSQAADVLGIQGGEVEGVAVRLAQDYMADTGVEELAVAPEAETESTGVEPFDELEAPAVDPAETVEKAETDETANESDGAKSTAETVAVGTEEASPVEAPETADSAAEEKSKEESFLWDLASRTPQKNLFTPPREAETFLPSDAPVEVAQAEIAEAKIAETEPVVSEAEAEPVETSEESPEMEVPLPDIPMASVETPAAVGSEPPVFTPSEPLPPDDVEEVPPTATMDRPETVEVAMIDLRPAEPLPPSEEGAEGPSTSTDIPEPIAVEPPEYLVLEPLPPEEERADAPFISSSIVYPPEESWEFTASEPAYPLEPEMAGELPPVETEEISEPTVTVQSEPVDIATAEDEVEEEPGLSEPQLESFETTLVETPETEEQPEAVMEVEVDHPEVAVAVTEDVPEAKPVETTRAFVELPSDRERDRTYYIQLGAYLDMSLAQSLEASYSSQFPVEVLAAAKLFRVLVGPLNKDESGTLLFWFKAKGFSDAFIRSTR